MDFLLVTKSLNETNCELEALWLEILNKAGKNILLGVVYHHPRKDSAHFSEYLQSVFNKIYRENKLVILFGDFNLNLLKHDKVPNVEAFLNFMSANFYRPLITHTARIHADSCPSLIDNIFINTLEYETVSGNLIDSVSGHLPNFAFLANGNVMKGKDRSLVRDYRSCNSKEYIEDFSKLGFRLVDQ